MVGEWHGFKALPGAPLQEQMYLSCSGVYRVFRGCLEGVEGVYMVFIHV